MSKFFIENYLYCLCYTDAWLAVLKTFIGQT